jgi:hypothetical protein
MMLTNKWMLLQYSFRSLFYSELTRAAMSPDCKSWANRCEPKGSNEEEEYSNDCVIRPFGSARRSFIGLPERQLVSYGKLEVFFHDHYTISRLLMCDGELFAIYR